MSSRIIRKQRLGFIALLYSLLFAIPHSAAAQAPNFERGRILFEQVCTQCHGIDGNRITSVGKAVKAKVLRDPAVQNQNDAELYKQIAEGSQNMPPFAGTYRNDQIHDMVAYLGKLGEEQGAAVHTPNVEGGRILFEQACAQCHGLDGSKISSVGKAVKAKVLRDPAVQNQNDAELYKQIAEGSQNMPPFAGTYRNDQINDVVAYLGKLGEQHAGAAQAPNVENGRILFEQVCSQCHGADGSKTTSVGKAVKAKVLRDPSVQNQNDAELYKQIAEGSSIMPPFAGTYRNDQINDLVAYIQELGSK
jgi:mono/diheme cytochrome c family protein